MADAPGYAVCTLRELNQQMARIIGEVEAAGTPVFITRRGRYIAVITRPGTELAESQILEAISRALLGDRGNDD